MPHSREVRATSHDRHDPMLVAALAADDLAGTDRDQAIALTNSCADCASLRYDLVALARASASAPPPISSRPRDFRLTPADAARLRPARWRRLVGVVAGSRSAVTRPLGAGLATLGIAGLLLGNVSLGSSAGSAAPPHNQEAAPSGAASRTQYDAAAAPAPSGAAAASAGTGAGAAPAASFAASAPTASFAAGYGDASGAPSAAPVVLQSEGVVAAPVVGSAAGSPQAEDGVVGDGSTGLLSASDADTPGSQRALNLLFAAAVVLGLGLIGWSVIGRRRPL
jgi:hypothetical protein